jgi:hypothetical protein
LNFTKDDCHLPLQLNGDVADFAPGSLPGAIFFPKRAYRGISHHICETFVDNLRDTVQGGHGASSSWLNARIKARINERSLSSPGSWRSERSFAVGALIFSLSGWFTFFGLALALPTMIFSRAVRVRGAFMTSAAAACLSAVWALIDFFVS